MRALRIGIGLEGPKHYQVATKDPEYWYKGSYVGTYLQGGICSVSSGMPLTWVTADPGRSGNQHNNIAQQANILLVHVYAEQPWHCDSTRRKSSKTEPADVMVVPEPLPQRTSQRRNGS